MKKKIYIGVAVLLTAILAYVLYVVLTPPLSPSQTTVFNDRGLDLQVVYCRPSKRGRLIFGEEKDGALQPYGEYWRLGANAPTEIMFSKNVFFAGKPVDAGRYRMYVVPGSDSFQISLNSDIGGFFGAGEPDYEKDVVKVDLPVQTVPETEQFVINFSSDTTGVNMDFVWDKTFVRVPISLQ